MFLEYISLLKDIEWTGILDIGIATILIWFGIHALLNMKSRIIVMGLASYVLLIILAKQVGLNLTFWLIQGVAAVVVLAVIVAHQKEIRRIIERISGSILDQNQVASDQPSILADLISDTLQVLSTNQRGAIIVVAGAQPLEGHIAGEISLKGKLSKALLLSIFDPNSPGHDGAVIIKDGQAESFGCRLPLSDQDEQLVEKGTRHAAALGLSEVTDSIVLIVSEETGKMSVAEGGKLFQDISSAFLKQKILSFYGEKSSGDSSGRKAYHWLWDTALHHPVESFFAPLIAFIL